MGFSSRAMGQSVSKESFSWWQQCRAETPGCKHVMHFNSAGAALQPQVVINAVNSYLTEETLTGGYETAARRSEELKAPYTALARLFNCQANEIAITSSATSAWSQVFYGIPWKSGDVILTSMAEYGSNYLAYLQVQKRHGVIVQVIPETEDGDISIPHLTDMLNQQRRPVLLSISHIPTSSGRVYDAAAVGAAAAAAGVPYLLDACQSAGQMPLDVQQLQCDFLTGTSRKYFRGPRGVGFLYARNNSSKTFSSSSSSSSSSNGVWEPAVIDNHGASWTSSDRYKLVDGAAKYEQYELNCAAMVGFGAAVQYCLDQDINRCWQRTQDLAAQLRHKLKNNVLGLTLHDKGRVLCGIVSFTLEAVPDAAEVKAWLAGHKPPINVSVSGIGSTRLDFEARGLQEIVRASVAYYNSEEELDMLVAALQQLVQQQQQQR